jgi:hypothetical protein
LWKLIPQQTHLSQPWMCKYTSNQQNRLLLVLTNHPPHILQGTDQRYHLDSKGGGEGFYNQLDYLRLLSCFAQEFILIQCGNIQMPPTLS